MKEPLVSINCITYNHEKYIAKAIDSFLMQKTNFEYEIIIGEDCSTDGTRRIINEYMKRYPGKIRLITSAENVGVMKNDLRVLEASRGKYIACCEGDDYWTDPFKLQKQADYMEAHPDCSLYVHAAEVVDYTKSKSVSLAQAAEMDTKFTIFDILKNPGNLFPTASMFLRRDLINPLPDFYMKCSVGDFPMKMILAHQGYIFYKNEVMSVYRYGYQGSWSATNILGTNLRDKKIRNHRSDIFIFENFNIYSNYKYNKQVNEAVMVRKAEIALFEKDFSILNTFYKEQSRLKKLKLRIFAFMPDLYIKLLNLKAEMKRQFVK